MFKNMRCALSLLIGLIVLLLTRIQGDPVDSENWHVVGPLSEVRNSILYQAQSDFGGKHYESEVYGHDLEITEKWKSGKELPTSLTNILTNAQNAFHKEYPQFSGFKVMSINFVHLTIVDDWVVNVEFNGTNFAAVSPGSFEDRKINILVLLNGHVITPTVSETK